MFRVLLVGRDESLLCTRRLVLSRTGADVLGTKLDEVIATPPMSKIDVLVICHTVPQEARQALISNFRKLWPALRVVQILKSEYEVISTEIDANFVAIGTNPGQLVSRTAALFLD